MAPPIAPTALPAGYHGNDQIARRAAAQAGRDRSRQLRTSRDGPSRQRFRDEYLYIANGDAIAIDDPSGASLSDVNNAGQEFDSIAIGGSNEYAFYAGAAIVGDGSIELRTGGAQSLFGPFPPRKCQVGLACINGACWVRTRERKNDLVRVPSRLHLHRSVKYAPRASHTIGHAAGST